MIFSFWQVITSQDGNSSRWEKVDAPYEDRDHDGGIFTLALTFGVGKAKFYNVCDWSEWQGCESYAECNFLFICIGILEVQVGEVVRTFGPGQIDGQFVCFSDILKIEHFANGHRIRVVQNITAIQNQMHRVSQGD